MTPDLILLEVAHPGVTNQRNLNQELQLNTSRGFTSVQSSRSQSNRPNNASEQAASHLSPRELEENRINSIKCVIFLLL